MYQLIKTFENSTRYFHFDKNFFASFINGYFSIYEKKSFSVLWQKKFESVEQILSTKKEFVISAKKGNQYQYFYFDKLSGKKIDKNLPYETVGISGISNDLILYEGYPNKNLSSRVIGLIDDNGKKIWEKESDLHCYFFEGRIIGAKLSSSDNNILSLKDGSVLWNIPGIENQTQMPHILGFINDFIFIKFNTNILRKINYKTQEIIQEWNAFPSEIYTTKNKSFLKKEQKVFGIIKNQCWELDLISNKIETFSLSNNDEKNTTRSTTASHFDYNQGFIYLHSHLIKPKIKGFGFEHIYKIECINYKIKKVVWSYSFPNIQYQLTSSIVDGDLLYDLDRNMNLYIFKKN